MPPSKEIGGCYANAAINVFVHNVVSVFAFISLRWTPQSVFSNSIFISSLPNACCFLYNELNRLICKAVEAIFTSP